MEFSAECEGSLSEIPTYTGTLQFFSMYPSMGITLYRWGVMANLAGMCGN